MKENILYAVGDVGPCREDLDSMFTLTAPILKSGAVSFCQLEPVLTDRGTPLPQARLTCSSTPKVAGALKRAGFDVVSFATNHCMDWGRDGFFDTLDALKEAGLSYMGAGSNLDEARKSVILDANGVKIAFLAYCSILPQDYWAKEKRAGVAPLRAYTVYEQVEHDQPGTPCKIHTYPHREDMKNMQEDIKKAKQEADIVVVSAHWGIHFKEAVIAEYQRDYAYAAIDCGADLILGHHPHILKPIEVYKGKAVFYSLGNFGMEEISQMKRDLEAYGQAHGTSKQFLEMKAIAPEWEKSKRSFPPDSYKSMIAKCVIEDKRISQVSYLPVDIPLGNVPVAVIASDEVFTEITNYVEKITKAENIDTKYVISGDEVIIEL